MATVGMNQNSGRFNSYGAGAKGKGLALLPSLISALAPLHVEEESENEDDVLLMTAGYCMLRQGPANAYCQRQFQRQHQTPTPTLPPTTRLLK